MLSKDTIDSLIAEYRDAKSDEIALLEQETKLAGYITDQAVTMRANKKQITSLRAILKANDVDTKAL